jgi:hypothetical protein
MRVGKAASRVHDMRLLSLATASGIAIKAMHNPHAATARFLIALADELQSAEPHPEPRPPGRQRKPPGRR